MTIDNDSIEFKLAAVQTDVRLGDWQGNMRQVLQAIDAAADSQTQLVVFPECMLTGYCFESRQEALQVAVSVEDDCWQPILEATARLSCHVVLGFLETNAAGQLFNASALIGPEGFATVYRKVHLPHLGVDRFADRGDRAYRSFAAGQARIGLAICYDSSFPEPMRVLGLAGADIIALGTNWPIAARRTAELVPPARSMENHLFFVAANRVGTERGFQFCGCSSICGPDGVVLASVADDQETILYADVNLRQARNKRIERTVGAHVIDRFADRRPEFYGEVVRPHEQGVDTGDH